jgi:AraC family transcriptional regulator
MSITPGPAMFRIVDRSYAARSRIAAHTHALPSMSIVTAGMLHERSGRRFETALPFSVSLMAADVRHDDEFGPHGASLFQVHFDGDFERELADGGCRALSGWTWMHGGRAARSFVQFVTAFRHCSERADELIADVRAQLIAEVLAAAAHDGPASGGAPVWLDQIRERIDDTHGWPRVSELAASARVHRVYLARQFRRFYGCSVSDYVRRRRVQFAAHRIGMRRGTLSEVAHACGFHDHAHMCRAFQQECALSPSAFAAAFTPRSPRDNDAARAQSRHPADPPPAAV